MPPSEMTQEVFDTHHAEAVEAHKAAGAEIVDDAAKLLSDMVALGSEIGLSARQG
jgi:F-type H+-transporting ATPase subunit epsilon